MFFYNSYWRPDESTMFRAHRIRLHIFPMEYWRPHVNPNLFVSGNVILPRRIPVVEIAYWNSHMTVLHIFPMQYLCLYKTHTGALGESTMLRVHRICLHIFPMEYWRPNVNPNGSVPGNVILPPGIPMFEIEYWTHIWQFYTYFQCNIDVYIKHILAP